MDAEPNGRLRLSAQDGVLTIHFSGRWILGADLPAGPQAVAEAATHGALKRVVLNGQQLGKWDTSLLLVVAALDVWRRDKGIPCSSESMPDGVAGLIHLASAAPERKDARREAVPAAFLERCGRRALATWERCRTALTFLGEVLLSFGRLINGRAQYRRSDCWFIMEQCGPQALVIVTVISILVGAVLAFVGAMQLRMFGVELLVADMVGIGMVIEMGALMTGIILAGRTGAAFAAQLGTMQVNEEIDALRTLGISPVDYLVLPRLVALALMTPLLVIYADVLGILGGSLVGIFFLDIPPVLFFNETREVVSTWYCAQGLIKGATFGLVIALAGCLRGLECGRSAAAVGSAATSAVVTSIMLIVLSDAVWTYVFVMIG